MYLVLFSNAPSLLFAPDGDVSLEELADDEVGDPDRSTMVAARDKTSRGDSGGLMDDVPVTSKIMLELLDFGEKLAAEFEAAAAPELHGKGGAGDVADIPKKKGRRKEAVEINNCAFSVRLTNEIPLDIVCPFYIFVSATVANVARNDAAAMHRHPFPWRQTFVPSIEK